VKKKGFIVSFFLLLASDLVLKFCALKYIPKMTWFHTVYPFGGIGIFRDFHGISFSLNCVENTGAAWGIFSEHSDYLFIFRCIVVVSLILFAAFFNKQASRRIPLLLIISGASGNILDYMIYGHVIDFFHFNFWGYTFPIFNLADSMITTGVGVIFLQSFLSKKKRKAPPKKAPGTA
jgi:signal peptidase II